MQATRLGWLRKIKNIQHLLVSIAQLAFVARAISPVPRQVIPENIAAGGNRGDVEVARHAMPIC